MFLVSLLLSHSRCNVPAIVFNLYIDSTIKYFLLFPNIIVLSQIPTSETEAPNTHISMVTTPREVIENGKSTMHKMQRSKFHQPSKNIKQFHREILIYQFMYFTLYRVNIF